MKLTWFVRGRDWGLRFLRTADDGDPLPPYERAFASISDEHAGWVATSTGAALRFPDPLGRDDRSGRRIIHDVLVYPPDSDRIHSLDEGVAMVWPLLEADYARDYPLPRPVN